MEQYLLDFFLLESLKYILIHSDSILFIKNLTKNVWICFRRQESTYPLLFIPNYKKKISSTSTSLVGLNDTHKSFFPYSHRVSISDDFQRNRTGCN